MLSDPGPRMLGAPAVPFRDDEDVADDGTSLATENSDEEPLPGEPAVHVEAMLRRCLDEDERQSYVPRGEAAAYRDLRDGVPVDGLDDGWSSGDAEDEGAVDAQDDSDQLLMLSLLALSNFLHVGDAPH